MSNFPYVASLAMPMGLFAVQFTVPGFLLALLAGSLIARAPRFSRGMSESSPADLLLVFIVPLAFLFWATLGWASFEGRSEAAVLSVIFAIGLLVQEIILVLLWVRHRRADADRGTAVAMWLGLSAYYTGGAWLVAAMALTNVGV